MPLSPGATAGTAPTLSFSDTRSPFCGSLLGSAFVFSRTSSCGVLPLFVAVISIFPRASSGFAGVNFRDGESNVPTWMIERNSIVPKTEPRRFFLRSGDTLDDEQPAETEPGDSYAYPLPSPDLTEPGTGTGTTTFKVPVTPGGSVAYTTEPFEQDLVVAGPASLDLWLSSTASDTDLQVTLTEVRPDGQETYVQRGWLRASHRKLDPARSTALRPYHTHLRADAQPLERLAPTFMRVEVFPFAHAFRAGSRLRLWIDAPTSHTGFWAFAPHPEPTVNTVLHDPDHPSRLVLGRLPRERAEAPLPECDVLRNQPCRPDPLAQ